MEVCSTIDAIRRAVGAARAAGRSIGLVPTMGNLHAGHASLIDASVAEERFTVVSIFVNPTQFGPGEDFDAYPRTPAEDLGVCEARGAEAVFAPPVDEMYPRPGRTTVRVDRLTGTLCGASRPGHFDGVCTVVSKLLHIVGPDAAYFGQKDAQQAAVVGRMIADLDFPVRMVVCPTVREADGLAMSSRNRYLRDAERREATSLHEALLLAEAAIAGGQTDAGAIRRAMAEHIRSRAPSGRVDYAEIVDPETMEIVEDVSRPVLAAVAVRFPSARLIDNLRVDPPAGDA